MEAKHTATPTQASGNALQLCDASTGHCVRNVAFCDTAERAAAIVCAVNAHDGLVKALQEIVKNDPYNQSSAGIIARAALAKAGA